MSITWNNSRIMTSMSNMMDLRTWSGGNTVVPESAPKPNFSKHKTRVLTPIKAKSVKFWYLTLT